MFGSQYGRLTVTAFPIDPKGTKHPRCECRCTCGAIIIVQVANLARTHSCGCLKRELLHAKATHGLSNSPEYRIWAGMLGRCRRVNFKDFDNYGGRGVTVCQRWVESFEAFYADMGPRPSAKHTIERRNNDGNYEPNNCCWATRWEQNQNRRSRRWKVKPRE